MWKLAPQEGAPAYVRVPALNPRGGPNSHGRTAAKVPTVFGIPVLGLVFVSSLKSKLSAARGRPQGAPAPAADQQDHWPLEGRPGGLSV